jgi:3D (Asp-Asp-Asp) domain-containing protein
VTPDGVTRSVIPDGVTRSVIPDGVRVAFGVLAVVAVAGCGGWGAGSSWVNEPLAPEERGQGSGSGASRSPRPPPVRARTLGVSGTREGERDRGTDGGGRLVGTFRNTYYDFPKDAGAKGGPAVSLMSPSCTEIAKVSRAFHDAVCVQGSGSLERGGTVSFAKRDCACAEVCPRTGQRICFDALDPASFPYGRGAAGRPIAPLRTVAADTNVLPMGTVIWVPELEGVTSAQGGDASDGCFVVEDRGLRVQGEHIDVFTGDPQTTAIVNSRVPSNTGVRVIVDSPRCARLRAP